MSKSVKFSSATTGGVSSSSPRIHLPPKTPYPGKKPGTPNIDKPPPAGTSTTPVRDQPPLSCWRPASSCSTSTAPNGKCTGSVESITSSHKVKTTTQSVHAETGQLQSMQAEPTATASNAPVAKRRSAPTIKATVVAEKLRQQSNSSCLNHVRSIKYQVATLHEYLLKVEEEIKLANKGRRTLELAVQDARKFLSVNQQSLNAQQKRVRGTEDSMLVLFREEARTLSKCKRDLESHLQVIKHQLQVLDNVRKLLQSKISLLSKSLHLDAQSYKLYDGPVDSPPPPHSMSKHREYANKCQKPPPDFDTQLPAQLLTSVTQAMESSKEKRNKIKSLVISVHTRQSNAHRKVNSTISQSIDEAQSQRRSIALEKGQVRLQRNSVTHETHTVEITLGLVSGPVSEQYKSVAERQDRPLSRVRPASALDELNHAKETKTKLTRQLSASQVLKSSVTTTEHSLVSRDQERSKSASFDSQLLRVRKMSLDNRWVS